MSSHASPSIVFADMDGTFLATDKAIPPANLRVLDELETRGIIFVPCTGRPVGGVPAEILAHPATRYAVGSNGAVVYDVQTGRNLHVRAMDKQAVLDLYARVNELEIATTFDVFVDGKVYAEQTRYDALGSYGIDEPTLEVLRRVRKPVDLLVPEIVRRARIIEKITCFWRDTSDCAALGRVVREMDCFSSAHGHPKDFELQAKGVSKGSALVWLCAYLGLRAADSVAFGDETNDLSLLEAAGVGVAMANATQEVRVQADCITTSNDGAGVATYLNKTLGL